MNTSIECKEGYWTIEKKSIQTINCTDANWKSNVLPCIGRFIIHLGIPYIYLFMFSFSTYISKTAFFIKNFKIEWHDM